MLRLIALLLLTGPGFFAWFIEGNTELENWRDVVKAVAKWTVNNYLIVTVMYLALNTIYDDKQLSFSAEKIDKIWNSIYEISFVAKYSVITAILAVALGLLERIVLPRIRAGFERRFADGKK